MDEVTQARTAEERNAFFFRCTSKFVTFHQFTLQYHHCPQLSANQFRCNKPLRQTLYSWLCCWNPVVPSLLIFIVSLRLFCLSRQILQTDFCHIYGCTAFSCGWYLHVNNKKSNLIQLQTYSFALVCYWYVIIWQYGKGILH